MNMQNRHVFISLLFYLFLISCKKELPNCKSNCTNISISGRVYFVPELTPVNKVLAEARFYSNERCLLCTPYLVGSEQTSNDGSFNFSRVIDSSYFNDYSLSILIPRDSNYIIQPSQGGVHASYDFYDFDATAFRNLRFEYYRKAELTIRLHRTQNDNFYLMGVAASFRTLSFGEAPGTGYTTINGPNAMDTTCTVQTAANVYTKITLSKKLTDDGPFVDYVDSIICAPNQPNTIEINY